MPPENAAPAAAAPVQAAPAAAPAAPAPAAAAAAPAAAPAAPAAAAATEPKGNLVADAKAAAAAPAAAEKPAIADQRAYLAQHTEDGKTDAGKKLLEGKTDEEIGKLYDALKVKQAEDAKKPVDPKSIEIKLPEGFTIDDATRTQLQEVLADANLSPQDRGQKLVDLHVAAMKMALDEPMKLWNKTQADWQAEVMADKEIGGQNWKASEAAIDKALNALAGAKGTPAGNAVREAFAMTGAGNNPAIVRMMVKVASLITEGTPAPGNPAAPGGDAAKTLAALYPSAVARPS